MPTLSLRRNQCVDSKPRELSFSGKQFITLLPFVRFANRQIELFIVTPTEFGTKALPCSILANKKNTGSPDTLVNSLSSQLAT